MCRSFTRFFPRYKGEYSTPLLSRQMFNIFRMRDYTSQYTIYEFQPLRWKNNYVYTIRVSVRFEHFSDYCTRSRHNPRRQCLCTRRRDRKGFSSPHCVTHDSQRPLLRTRYPTNLPIPTYSCCLHLMRNTTTEYYGSIRTQNMKYVLQSTVPYLGSYVRTTTTVHQTKWQKCVPCYKNIRLLWKNMFLENEREKKI